jgi:hypothetical protein
MRVVEGDDGGQRLVEGQARIAVSGHRVRATGEASGCPKLPLAE